MIDQIASLAGVLRFAIETKRFAGDHYHEAGILRGGDSYEQIARDYLDEKCVHVDAKTFLDEVFK